MTTRLPPSPHDHITQITHSPNPSLSDRAGGLVTLPQSQDHPIVQSPNSERERGGGQARIRTLEACRRQIYSLFPLSTWVPARTRVPGTPDLGRSFARSSTACKQENDLRASSSLAENKQRPALFPSGNRGWWIDPHSRFCQETTNSIEKPHPCQERPVKRLATPLLVIVARAPAWAIMTQA